MPAPRTLFCTREMARKKWWKTNGTYVSARIASAAPAELGVLGAEDRHDRLGGQRHADRHRQAQSEADGSPIRTFDRSAVLSPLATANSVSATLPGTIARNDVTMNAV